MGDTQERQKLQGWGVEVMIAIKKALDSFEYLESGQGLYAIMSHASRPFA
jgi:hypothetical protein